MKLYPCNHNIYNVDKIDTVQDIAISYLDSGFVKTDLSKNIESKFKIESKMELIPYEVISDLDIALFDKYGDAVTSEYKNKIFTRANNGEYVYKPNSSLTFDPMIFNYKVIAKKNIKYLSSRKYNINIACSDTLLSQTLIQYFSDSYKRDLCPTNIMFNNGDIQIQSLSSGSYVDKDFIFIESMDGIKLKNGDDIDIDLMLNNGVIPFIICDTIDGKITDSEEEIDFNILNNNVINTDVYRTKYYFNVPTPNNDETIHTIFGPTSEYSPIIIKEKINKGFVIYCNSEFISRISESYGILYEVLMYAYMNSYAYTQKLSQWISDEMPNYIYKNGRLVQKERFTSHIELYKMLGLMEGDIHPVSVVIDPPAGEEEPVVYYTGMRDDFLVFKKLKTDKFSDPIKKKDQISIYTERKNIIYFDEFIYKITNDIENKIHCETDNSEMTVAINSFKNTYLNSTGLWKDSILNIRLDDNLAKQDVHIMWLKNEKTIRLQKTINISDILLATISVTKTRENSKLFDMRRRGGGLPDEIQNYNCLDIGNILGRPYRKGGTLIARLTLPIKYEYLKDKIKSIAEEAINKNKSAGDYLVLDIDFK